jgi:hypothetical protein
MNVWKPIALVSAAGLVASICIQTASAEGGACHNQPNMAAAVEHLRAARASLEHAEHNKGGWRDRAIQSADVAIREAKAGCEFADTH